MTLLKKKIYCAEVRTEYCTTCAKPVVKYSSCIKARAQGTTRETAVMKTLKYYKWIQQITGKEKLEKYINNRGQNVASYCFV